MNMFRKKDKDIFLEPATTIPLFITYLLKLLPKLLVSPIFKNYYNNFITYLCKLHESKKILYLCNLHFVVTKTCHSVRGAFSVYPLYKNSSRDKMKG